MKACSTPRVVTTMNDEETEYAIYQEMLRQEQREMDSFLRKEAEEQREVYIKYLESQPPKRTVTNIAFQNMAKQLFEYNLKRIESIYVRTPLSNLLLEFQAMSDLQLVNAMAIYSEKKCDIANRWLRVYAVNARMVNGVDIYQCSHSQCHAFMCKLEIAMLHNLSYNNINTTPTLHVTSLSSPVGIVPKASRALSDPTSNNQRCVGGQGFRGPGSAGFFVRALMSDISSNFSVPSPDNPAVSLAFNSWADDVVLRPCERGSAGGIITDPFSTDGTLWTKSDINHLDPNHVHKIVQLFYFGPHADHDHDHDQDHPHDFDSTARLSSGENNNNKRRRMSPITTTKYIQDSFDGNHILHNINRPLKSVDGTSGFSYCTIMMRKKVQIFYLSPGDQYHHHLAEEVADNYLID